MDHSYSTLDVYLRKVHTLIYFGTSATTIRLGVTGSVRMGLLENTTSFMGVEMDSFDHMADRTVSERDRM